MTGFLGFIGQRDSLVPDSGLERTVRSHLEFDRLQDAPIPLHVTATDVLTGEAVPGSRHWPGRPSTASPEDRRVELGAATIYVPGNRGQHARVRERRVVGPRRRRPALARAADALTSPPIPQCPWALITLCEHTRITWLRRTAHESGGQREIA